MASRDLTQVKKLFLDTLLKKGSLRIAPSLNELFTLKAGRKSRNFINMGALTDGESLSVIKTAYAVMTASMLNENKISDFEFVFGPAYKGINLACLACEGLHELFGLNKRYLYDRKEEKDYADKKMDQVIVGAGYFKQGDRILLVDDVITTGGTKVEALEKLSVLGNHKVVGMVIAVDRQEKMGDSVKVEELSAIESIEKNFGIKTFPILNMQEIFSLVKDELKPEIKKSWIEYYEKYGAVKLS